MRLVVSLVLLVLLFQSISAQEIKEIDKFNPSFTIAGRLMFDYGSYDYKNEPDKSFTGSEIRRAMLETSGELSKHIGFVFQIDFAREIFNFKEVNLYFKDLPKIGGRLTIGNILVPFNLDKITSSKFITFMERASAASYMRMFKTKFLYENFNIWQNRIGVQVAYTGNGAELRGINYHLTEGQGLYKKWVIICAEPLRLYKLLFNG